MNLRTCILILLVCITSHLNSQNLETNKLDEYFNSLEKRNESMGSIAISKNGKIIYSKAIGYKTIEGDKKTNSNTDTHFKIWSITKTYTAVMIFQLIEEGKLSLETTLNNYFPQIPHAEKISIKRMLGHRSGIFDYVNDTDENVNLNGITSKDDVADVIAQFKPKFNPGEHFRYSNSNYLLLGYIIELLDDSTYETSLKKRITSKVNLKHTYFGTKIVQNLKNKANTFKYDKGWQKIQGEASYEDHLQTADGGIVATIEDMVLFIDALFDERLVSKHSLDTMLEGEDFYRLGLMRTQFYDNEGFGHTGGWLSESSLYYYPKDSMAIGFATNGFLIRKEEILDNVLKIYHGKTFAISMNRYVQAFLIFGIGLLFFLIITVKFRQLLSVRHMLYSGYLIAILFWVGTIISGFLHGNHYSHISHGIPILDAYYSGSGTFNSSIQLLIVLLFIPFLYSAFKSCKRLSINVIPLFPLVFIPLNMIGTSLFPFPNSLFPIFANCIILSILGPLLAIILWRKKELTRIRQLSAVSFFVMIVSIGFLISRSSFPETVQTYWGLIQRLLFLGWTSWIIFLTFYLTKVKVINNAHPESH